MRFEIAPAPHFVDRVLGLREPGLLLSKDAAELIVLRQRIDLWA